MKARQFVTGVLMVCGLSAGPVLAGEAPPKPIEGPFTPIHFAVTNAATEPMECQAVAGHWYSFALPGAVPGKVADLALFFAPKTGTLVMFNEAKDPLPIEQVVCGFAGHAYETQYRFPMRALARQAAGTGKPVPLTCRTNGGRLDCGD